MEAKDRAANEETFEAKVHELAYGRFMLTCNIARPLGETKESITDGEIKTDVLNNKYLGQFMPKLPPEDPFIDDSGRFYVLKRSEVKCNGWIRLYLELAVGTTFRKHFKHGVTNLKIARVAMEIPRDLDPFHKGLGAYDAIFYIEYKDSCKARVGDDVDRVAIVRGILDKHTQVLRLVGRTQSSSQTMQPSNAMEAGSSSSALD